MVNHRRDKRPPPVRNPALKSWTALNDALRTADEALCTRLLKAEQKGRARKSFLIRIHGRRTRLERKRLRGK